MDKAITVTQDNKTRNPRYLSNALIGAIIIFSETRFPKVWSTKDWTKEYFNRLPEFHTEAGFYEVREPALEQNEYFSPQDIFLEDSDPQDLYYTYPVKTYTPEEIAAQAEEAEHAQAGNTESRRAADGDSEARYIFKELRRLFNKGTLSKPQFDTSQNLLFDALLPMTYGLWDVTKLRLDAITPPINATLLGILNNIKARVDYYIANNERQEERLAK